jgi:hypothetical protein
VYRVNYSFSFLLKRFSSISSHLMATRAGLNHGPVNRIKNGFPFGCPALSPDDSVVLPGGNKLDGQCREEREVGTGMSQK